MKPHHAVTPLLNSLPSGWGRTSFKAALRRLDERNTGSSHAMLSLKSAGTLVPRGNNQEPSEGSIPRYLIAHPGDLVVNPMWLVGGAIGVSDVSGAVSPDYRVFRSRGIHHPRYLHYVLRSASYFDQYRLYTRADTTFDRRVQQPDLDGLPLPVPPMNEQVRIANFLDGEVARIDEIITLREEQRDAIARYVGDSRERLFASAHSDWIPLRWLASKIGSGKTPSGGADVYQDEGVAFLRSQNVHFDGLRLTDVAHISEEIDRDMRATRVQVGDVLLNITGGSIGRATSVTESIRANVNQHVCIVRMTDVDLSVFAAAGISTKAVQDQIGLCQVGGNREGLNFSQVGSLRVPIPPDAERRRVADGLASLTASAKGLEQEMLAQVKDLQERRASLITKTVIGQYEIPGAREELAAG